MARKYLKQRGGPVQADSHSKHVTSIVQGIIDSIRAEGDAAVRRHSEHFDKWSPPSFKLSQSEIEDAISTVPKQTIEDIKEVQRNVAKFAKAQRSSMKDFELETAPGVFLGQRNNPISSVGAYVTTSWYLERGS